MTVLRIDFEARSLVNLPDCGEWRYAEDDSTDVICMGYQIDDGPRKAWVMGKKFPLEVNQAIVRGCLVYAFNANMERAINWCLGNKIGMVHVPLSQWRDTQAIALMCGLPGSLGGVCEVLAVDQQKGKEGKQLINLYCKKYSKQYRPIEDNTEDLNSFVEYCMQDVAAERAAHEAFPIKHLGDQEQKVWEFDSEVNRRGIPVDLAFLSGGMKVIKEATIAASKQLEEITGGLVSTANQHARIKRFAAENGYPLQSTDAAALIAALTDETCPANVREVLTIRQAVGHASISKYQAAINAICKDGTVKSCHNYMGARTGRWTAKLLQPHNFAKPVGEGYTEDDNKLIANGDTWALTLLYSSPLNALRDCVRHMIRAPKGKQFVVCDLASIEARVLGWMAGEEKYQEAFRKGLDLYIVTATEIYKIPYDKVDEFQRWLGKQSVLGLGYSMWVDTFYDNCVKYKPDIEKALLEKAVRSYRRMYKNIVAYWGTMERQAVKAIAHPGASFKAGPVIFQMIKGYLTIWLPSGRRLWYPEAKLVTETNRYGKSKSVIYYKKWIMKKWVTAKTYGGKLVENAVQAVARDALTHGMMRMESQGIEVSFHVHDETVSVTDRAFKEVEGYMSEVPSWGQGLILGAKGFESNYYRKN